ncbi:hypothetical protein D2918_24190 [Klebsiella pneumoniae]|nr:hypothetical protein [Klebsiella pneumoniae]
MTLQKRFHAPEGMTLKSVLPFFFTVVKLTKLNERTTLEFAVQVADTQRIVWGTPRSAMSEADVMTASIRRAISRLLGFTLIHGLFLTFANQIRYTSAHIVMTG